MQVLAYTMADTLEAGGPVVEALLHMQETDLPAYWKPDAAFFELLRDKRAINAMVADIASPCVAKGCLTETGKVQKQLLANRIARGEGQARPDWRPVWMQVPPARLIAEAGSAPADAWGRVETLFQVSGTDAAPNDIEVGEPVAA
jgi:ParB family chromosome partitioning protein